MRALLAIVISVVFMAMAAGFLPVNDMPIVLRLIVGAFGLILLYGGLYHGRLRLRRRWAYRGGRDKSGEVILPVSMHDDSAIVEVEFHTNYGAWLMTIDAGSIGKVLQHSGDRAKAKAYFGDDDLIYAIDIGTKKLLPLSPGKSKTAEDERRLRKREELFHEVRRQHD